MDRHQSYRLWAMFWGFVMACSGWFVFGIATGFVFGLFNAGFKLGGVFWN